MPVPDLSISLERLGAAAAAEAAWRGLEGAAGASFFQSWTWTGCLAAERFPAPVLLRATRQGRTVALALCNRTRGPLGLERLWLGQSGDARHDAAYIEHNGPLVAAGAGDALGSVLAALLAAPIAGSRGVAPAGRVVRLAGVPEALRDEAARIGIVRELRRQEAPYLDLAVLPAGPDGLLATCSANTRAQLRRSDRAYAGMGAPATREADTAEEALQFFDALVALHQRSWRARGKPGAFADPSIIRFHRTLIARALPRREVALLRVGFGAHTAGYLYNFRFGGTVSAYQSGFDYDAAPLHGKPGLTCHHAAILRARDDGAAIYDFLAGPDRYKTSLANASRTLCWLDAAARGSAAGLILHLRTRLRR